MQPETTIDVAAPAPAPRPDPAVARAWAAVGTLIATGHIECPNPENEHWAEDLEDAVAVVAETLRIVG